MNDKERSSSIPAFFPWVQEHFGLWSLICTPDHERVNPLNMVDTIEKLAEAHLDELIFAMLTVHRNEPFVTCFYRTMLFDLIAEHWEDEREHIISKMIEHLQ